MSNIFKTEIRRSEFDSAALDEGFAPVTKITKYTLSNGCAEVDIIDYGATITAIRVPDRDGVVKDIVLGFRSIEGYMATKNNPYFGATVGRVANRIANGRFSLDRNTYVLSSNEGENTLHGGVCGFNRRMWSACETKEGLVMELMSRHLDQGFPGELTVVANFVLTRSNQLIIRYTATTDRPTIVNMTNHSYLNLAGHDSGPEKLYEHSLMIDANNFTPTDDNNIPIGKIQDVLDTVLDFTTPKNLGEAIKRTEEADGFDINFCLNGLSDMRLVACLEHPGSGRRLTIHSNQPGVQLYTANCTEVKEGLGKEGVGYTRHSGVCLETQNYPNAINEKHFPSCVLRPMEKYVHVISYCFSTFPPVEPTTDESIANSASLDEEMTDAYLAEPDQESSGNKMCEGEEMVECQYPCIFPNFNTGPRFTDTSLEYEPLSSVFPSSEGATTAFSEEVKQCKALVGHLPFAMPKDSNPTGFTSQGLNVVAHTDISRSWHMAYRK